MAVVVGTAGIILQAPSLYDDRSPIDKELSDIGQQVKRECNISSIVTVSSTQSRIQ